MNECVQACSSLLWQYCYDKLMSGFSNIVIIYNPRSTGPSEETARVLIDDLRQEGVDRDIKLISTEHAGHAEEISYKESLAATRPLIVSSSGDGGYHEVVNGVMRAKLEGAEPVASLLPSGNANDHWRTLSGEGLAARIAKASTVWIDLLYVQAKTREGVAIERYVHSYAGIGMTSYAGQRLNEESLGHLKQMLLVLNSLFSAPAEVIKVDGKYRRYDSLTFANIGGMAKYLSVSDVAKPDDGRFEVLSLRRRSRFLILLSLLKAATVGLREDSQVDSFSFSTIKDTTIQIDGEIYDVPQKASVEITIKPQVLECVI